MSEETGEHETVTTAPKELSFHGRLQLRDFMFNNASAGPRRSTRLRASQTPASISPESATTPAGQDEIATPEALALASENVSEVVSASASATPQSNITQKRKAQSLITDSSFSIKSPSNKKKKPNNNKNKDSDDTTTTTTTPHKRRPKPKSKPSSSSSYAPPSTYAHLNPLTDVITPDLLVLFIGLNPGVQTARSGHAYAHPSNLFWKLLYTSGLTPVPCRPEEDGTLPARFALGNTNIVSRPSRNGAELSKAEMDDGVAVLEEKCRRWRPEAVCLVGKGVWESIFRVWKGRNLTKAEFRYGWQEERMGAVLSPAAGGSEIGGVGGVKEEEEEGGEEEGVVDDGPWEGSRVFVATSTSGLAASLSIQEKERIWKILGDWCVQRRKERAEAEAEMKMGTKAKVKTETPC